VLELLGDDAAAVARIQGPSLLTKSARAAEFTSGYVFGPFSEEPNRHPIDLAASRIVSVMRPVNDA